MEYPNQSNCTYNITIPEGRVCLRFAAFYTETNYDYVTVYDGEGYVQLDRYLLILFHASRL